MEKNVKERDSARGKITSLLQRRRGAELTFQCSVGTASEGVTDYRHEGSEYVWRIEKTAGDAIDYNAEKSVFDEVFGQNAELIVTTTGIYCSSEAVGSIEVDDLNGYTVSLLEVRNPQYPAAGAVLWSNDSYLNQ